MDPEKRLGIILIIIGLVIPLLVLPFVSGFSREKGFYYNFYEAGIAIGKADRNDGASQPPPPEKGMTPKTRITWSGLIPKRIPFRLFLVPTVLLIYMGIIRIDRVRRRQQEH